MYFAPYIDDTGIHMPTYEDRLQDLLAAYRSIFGLDARLTPEVPDYQLLSVFARALDDTSALVLQAYNARDPMLATGAALDLLAPQYGLTRQAGESDADLRNRMQHSMASRGSYNPEAIRSAVLSVPYVKDCAVYENTGDSTDSRGIPAHSIAVVFNTGNLASVAKAVYDHKAPGIGTYGALSQTVDDGYGGTATVHLSRHTAKPTGIYLTIKKLAGCDESAVQTAITAVIKSHITNLRIAEPLIIPQLYGISYNADPAIAQTFSITSIEAALVADPNTRFRDTIPAAWNEKVTSPNGAVYFTFTA